MILEANLREVFRSEIWTTMNFNVVPFKKPATILFKGIRLRTNVLDSIKYILRAS